MTDTVGNFGAEFACAGLSLRRFPHNESGGLHRSDRFTTNRHTPCWPTEACKAHFQSLQTAINVGENVRTVDKRFYGFHGFWVQLRNSRHSWVTCDAGSPERTALPGHVGSCSVTHLPRHCKKFGFSSDSLRCNPCWLRLRKPNQTPVYALLAFEPIPLKRCCLLLTFELNGPHPHTVKLVKHVCFKN